MKFEFEEISSKYCLKKDGKSLKSSRVKVIGGWCLLHIQIQIINTKIIKSESMCFIPDPNHEWEIEK